MSQYKILYVEDNRTDFEMVKAVLEEHGLVDVMYRVEKKEEFHITLSENKIDIILTDFSLPVFHGLEVVQIAAEKYPGIPVIMVTGNLSDEIAVDIIKKGAWDYVLKENIYRLIPAIQSCIEKQKIRREKDVALKTLNESEAAYRSLAESSPYGIFVHVRERVFYHNKQAVRIITGRESGNFLGLKILDHVHPSDRESLKTRMEKLYRGERVEGVSELRFYNQQRKELILEIASSPITFQGYPAGQVIFKDIAERKRAELELIRAKEKAEESDRLKTAFLENMSHEIRTPLNGIIGFSSLLKIKNVSEEDRLMYISVIEESGQHLLSIIDDLIDVSRIETKQFELRNETFDLNEVMDDMYLFFNENQKYLDRSILLNLTRPRHPHKAIVYSDKGRLKQVLLNLLNNAYKFTDEGFVEFGYETAPGNIFRFFVRDSGTGIPDSEKNLVFERFRQAKNSKQRTSGGNGLGLTICKGIINAMGGGIWFESEVGKGTEFYFELKFQTDEKIPGLKRTRRGEDFQYYWKGKKILIAEDEPSNFRLLQEMLVKTGVDITRAVNGREVLEYIQNGLEPDLILLDIKLPEMSGIQVAKNLRKAKIRVPIIAQTAFAMSEDRDRCMEAGCDDFITKPVNRELLLNTINEFFEKK